VSSSTSRSSKSRSSTISSCFAFQINTSGSSDGIEHATFLLSCSLDRAGSVSAILKLLVTHHEQIDVAVIVGIAAGL
jgi:hypothetical protein